MTEEVIIGIRVVLAWVIKRSRVSPCLYVGKCTCCLRLVLMRMSQNSMVCGSSCLYKLKLWSYVAYYYYLYSYTKGTQI